MQSYHLRCHGDGDEQICITDIVRIFVVGYSWESPPPAAAAAVAAPVPLAARGWQTHKLGTVPLWHAAQEWQRPALLKKSVPRHAAQEWQRPALLKNSVPRHAAQEWQRLSLAMLRKSADAFAFAFALA